MIVYKIKQAPGDFAEATGLSKYGRSRMPGCFDVFQAAMDRSGRYITGLSKSEAAELKESLGDRYDFSDTSEFWETFAVRIEADNIQPFDSTVPMDLIGYKMMVANGYIAPDKEALETYIYKDSLYYSYNEETEDRKEVSSSKKMDRAKSMLLDISDNKEKMLLYGQYLEGIKYDSKLHEPTLYKMLRAFIEASPSNVATFISLFEKPVDELQAKVIIDKALKKRLISKVNLGKNKYVYQYGQVTLGGTIEDVYKNLASIEFGSELKNIKDEMNK